MFYIIHFTQTEFTTRICRYLLQVNEKTQHNKNLQMTWIEFSLKKSKNVNNHIKMHCFYQLEMEIKRIKRFYFFPLIISPELRRLIVTTVNIDSGKWMLSGTCWKLWTCEIIQNPLNIIDQCENLHPHYPSNFSPGQTAWVRTGAHTRRTCTVVVVGHKSIILGLVEVVGGHQEKRQEIN